MIDTIPNGNSLAATVVILNVLYGTKGALVQYGLLGELVRVGGIAVLFAITL